MISGEALLRKTAQVTLYSTFKFDKDQMLSEERARELLVESGSHALGLIESMTNKPKTHYELLVLYDNLQGDYMKHTHNIDIELWQTACFKYGLHEDQQFIEDLDNICN